MRTCKIIVAALIVTVVGGPSAGSAAGQSSTDGANRQATVGLAAVYHPVHQTLEVFAVDDSGAVRGVWKERNSIWRPPFNLTPPGFAPPGAPLVAVSHPEHRTLEVFVVGTDGAVRGVAKPSDRPWGAPWNLTTAGFAPPRASLAAVYHPVHKTLEVFVVGTDGAVRGVAKLIDRPWGDPWNLTGPNFAPPGAPLAAVSHPEHRTLEVFIVGNDGAVRGVAKLSDRPWGDPWNLTTAGFAPPGASLAAVYHPVHKTLEVFVVGNDGAVRGVAKLIDRPWGEPWNLTPPGFASKGAPLAAVSHPVHRTLEVFVVDGGGAVRGVAKLSDRPWGDPWNLSGAGLVPPSAPLAAVSYPVNNILEVYAVDGSGAARGMWKGSDRPWEGAYHVTGAGFGPVFSPGDCMRWFRRWRNGAVETFMEDNCLWIMGIEQFCRDHQAFVTPALDSAGRRSHFKCAGYATEETFLEELEHLVRGIGQGLETATVAAAPYFGLVVSAVACGKGVIFACAALATDAAALAGLQLPAEAGEAAAIAAQVMNCVDGNIVDCAQLGARGARVAGVTIPGVDVARVTEDAQRCANGAFAACMRLGLMAADAAGVPVGLAPSDVADARDCLTGDSQACLGLGRSAAQAAAKAAGFPLNGVAQGLDNARRCERGESNACIELGKALVGSAVPMGAEHAVRCANGDSNACSALGTALIGSGLARDADNARRCERGDTNACIQLGRALVAAR
jgi:hypothetical protein